MRIGVLEHDLPMVIPSHLPLMFVSTPNNKYSQYTIIYHNGEYLILGKVGGGGGLIFRGRECMCLHPVDYGLRPQILFEAQMNVCVHWHNLKPILLLEV